MPIIARHLTIRGHVQGVFFRAWTVETARSLALSGWVRNRANGDVEVVVQGDELVVARFIEHLWTGPTSARVDDIHVTDQAPGEFSGFEKRGTV